MPNRSNLPIIKPVLFLLFFLCVITTHAQRNIDMVDSPVSTLGATTAKISTVNILSDSIVFVQVDIIPSSDLEILPNGISEQTVMKVGDKFFPMNNVAQVMPGSMFPLQNPEGYQGWHDAKANNVYNLIMTFIVPSMPNVESFSILPSDYSSNSENDYYSFVDVRLNQSGSEKAFSTTIAKANHMYSGPSVKSNKLSKLPKGEKICLIEAKNEKISSNGDRNSKDADSKLCKVIVLGSGVTGFIEKDALSTERNPLELLTDVVKLSQKGISNTGTDNDEESCFARIEFHNNTLTTVTITINNTYHTIDPLKTQTFRIGLKGDSESDEDQCYLVVKTEGLPPMIVRCNLTAGDSYYWEFVRANSIG